MRQKNGSGVREAEYDWHDASPEVLDAMAFRCLREGHDWVGAASITLRIYKVCRWCGQEVA